MMRKTLRVAFSNLALFSIFIGTALASTSIEMGDDGASFRSVNLPGTFDGLNAVSIDGSIAVGGSGGFGRFAGYRISTATGEFELIEDGIENLRATAGDGLTAFGFAADRLATGYPLGANSIVLGTGDLPGGSVFGEPFGASLDGSIVIGQSASEEGTQAFRWTAETGMVGMGDLPGGNFQSRALAISNDGQVIVGDSVSSREIDGTVWTSAEAFRWTEETGMVGLLDLPGGIFVSSAFGISGNGSVLVGESGAPGNSPGANRVPVKWTKSEGWVDLGEFLDDEAQPDGRRNGIAYDASFDGSVIVGRAHTSFVWTEESGIRTLQGVMADANIDLTGWSNLQVSAISDNGKIVVGGGRNPNDEVVAWIATMPNSFVGSVTNNADFNDDQLVDALDIDLLWSAVSNGSTDTQFDVSGDGTINAMDPEFLVVNVLNTNFGDADLNGHVEFADFLKLSANFGQVGGWADGDFDGNGTIAFADFLQLSGNFGKTPRVAAVPEPSSSHFLLTILTILFLRNPQLQVNHHLRLPQ